MQTKRRKLKAEEGKPMLTIGFSIYKVLELCINYLFKDVAKGSWMPVTRPFVSLF